MLQTARGAEPAGCLAIVCLRRAAPKTLPTFVFSLISSVNCNLQWPQSSEARLGKSPRRYTSKGERSVVDLNVGDTIREKREAILHIAARHGASQVRLIGSVAPGEARPDS